MTARRDARTARGAAPRILRTLVALGYGALAVATTAAGAIGLPRLLLRAYARRHDRVLFDVAVRRRVIALTIDDGPDDAATPRILDALQRHGARATFFLIGARVLGRDPLVRRIVAEAHEIGNHMMVDAPSHRLPPIEFRRRLDQAHSILSAFAPVAWFRPASGRLRNFMFEPVRLRGYRLVLGSVYPWDAQVPWPRLVSRCVLSNIHPGAIVVLHAGPGREHTAAVLDRVLPALARRGYRVTTVSGLLDAAREERDGPG